MSFTFPNRCIALVLFSFVLLPYTLWGQGNEETQISGKLSIDHTWESKIYLSYIPSFDDMYSMSNEMIIAETSVDSLGYFKFNIDFLPKGENLYRLHLSKKGDSRATLIIGGKDENYMFFIINHPANINFTCLSTTPPFKKISFKNSGENSAFQHISDMVLISDSIAGVSSAAKRLLIDEQLQRTLLSIADTSSNVLVGLYAIYKGKTNPLSNAEFYESFIKKWRNEGNAYYKTFEKKFPNRDDTSSILLIIAFIFILVAGAFLLGKVWLDPNRKIKNLSVQERKVFELLQQGDTNQAIANQLNIGLSTVKSHVSSIYSKLKVKSRKEITNMK